MKPQRAPLNGWNFSEAGAFFRMHLPFQVKWLHPSRSRHFWLHSSIWLSTTSMSLTLPATKSQSFSHKTRPLLDSRQAVTDTADSAIMANSVFIQSNQLNFILILKKWISNIMANKRTPSLKGRERKREKETLNENQLPGIIICLSLTWILVDFGKDQCCLLVGTDSTGDLEFFFYTLPTI